MATITIRNLDKKTVERLKELARSLGCSMERLSREILKERVESKDTILKAIEESWDRNESEIPPETVETLITMTRERTV